MRLQKEGAAFDRRFHEEILDEVMPGWRESYNQAVKKKIKTVDAPLVG